MKNNRTGDRTALACLLHSRACCCSAAACPPWSRATLTEVDLLPQRRSRTVAARRPKRRCASRTPWRIAHAKMTLLEDSSSAESSSIDRMCARIDERFSLCDDCELHVGVGGTYHSFEGTEGVVIPDDGDLGPQPVGIRLVPFLRADFADNPENVERWSRVRIGAYRCHAASSSSSGPDARNFRIRRVVPHRDRTC